MMSKQKSLEKRKTKKTLREKKGEPFEKLVATIESALRKSTGEIVKHNINIIEIEGLSRRIDVVIEGGKRILIECKDYKTSDVEINEIAAFANLCKNSKSDGIFVASSGFQSGAITLANFHNIKLLTVEQINEFEIRKAFQIPELNTLKISTDIVSFDLVIDEVHNDLLKQKHSIEKLYHENKELIPLDFILGLINEIREDIVFPNLKELLNKSEEIGKISEIIDVCFEIKTNTLISLDGVLIPLKQIFVVVNIGIEVNERDSNFFQYKDDQQIISNIITTKIEDQGEEFTVSQIIGKNGEYDAYLIPNFRSSEITKLVNLGELK